MRSRHSHPASLPGTETQTAPASARWPGRLGRWSVRRWLVVVAILGGALVITLQTVVALNRPPEQGPLRSVDVVNSFSFAVDPGETFSLVVWHRSEEPATATLRAVELIDADPRLQVMGSGISPVGLDAPRIAQFPPGPLMPVEGTVVTVDPTDPRTDLTIVFGLRADATGEQLDTRGVWLTYEVDGQRYRALVPWLVSVCVKPADQCSAQDPAEYELPD